MSITSFSVMIDYKTLNELTSKLNGARQHPAGKLNGMFFRRMDFESSTKQLMQQLASERMLALRFAQKGYANEEFKVEAAKNDVRTYSRTQSSFDTYDLSPALRHFLNDYCRVLEPLVKLLAKKYPTILPYNPRKPNELVSFNAYLKKLDRYHIVTPLDHDYFLAVYDELWNDYKHAESSGVQASSWSSSSGAINSEPKIHRNGLIYFRDMPVEDFIKKSLNNMNAVLDFIV